MELDFSSDTATPAELVHVLHGALLSALVRLNLMFHAGAERFAYHFCLLFLSLFIRYEDGSKGQGPGRPMEECDLAMQCEDTCVGDRVAVQRLVHGLVVWAF